MSASVEKILDEIREVEQNIKILELEGNSLGILHMHEVLSELKKRLVRANEVLNEGKSILKG